MRDSLHRYVERSCWVLAAGFCGLGVLGEGAPGRPTLQASGPPIVAALSGNWCPSPGTAAPPGRPGMSQSHPPEILSVSKHRNIILR